MADVVAPGFGDRRLLVCGAILGLTGVALGAFGAHGLSGLLEGRGSESAWETAVFYQLVHALALLAVAGWRGPGSASAAWPLACWGGGVVLFSGSLYALALGGPGFLGPVTPAGGVLLIAGWLWLLLLGLRRRA
jgi:uncharacterized membrane protein YgdD (TMEM256/DUF423 family)